MLVVYSLFFKRKKSIKINNPFWFEKFVAKIWPQLQSASVSPALFNLHAMWKLCDGRGEGGRRFCFDVLGVRVWGVG